MSEYTAEDFANARFAEHDNGRAAMRPQAGRLWNLGGVRMGDYDMARDGWRPAHETAPLTIDTLREAWENAEQSEDCRVGDTLIRRLSPRDFAMYEATAESHNLLPDMVRVHERAPEPREPWADLAEVMREWQEGDREDGTVEAEAAWLHERGVRVVKGGDES